MSNEGDPGTDKNSGHTVSVLNLRTGRAIDTLPTLRGPDGVAYDPNTGSIYVSNEDPGPRSLESERPRGERSISNRALRGHLYTAGS